MPFKSKSQWKLCYTLQKQGKGWNCDEWKRGVKYSSLPEKASRRSKSRSRSRKMTRRSRSRRSRGVKNSRVRKNRT